MSRIVKDHKKKKCKHCGRFNEYDLTIHFPEVNEVFIKDILLQMADTLKFMAERIEE